MDSIIAPTSKILKHPDVLSKFKAGEKLYPVNVEFDLSNACNLGCEWCAFGYTHNSILMDKTLAVSILKQLRQAGVKAITFSGGGEPTIHPDFMAIVTAAKGFGFDLGLYTNGVNIKNLQPVVGHFKWVYISLDAADADEYQQTKKRNVFGQVLSNIRALVENKHDATIGIGFLLDGDNYTKVAKMVKIIRATGADYGQFRPVVGLDDYNWIHDALNILNTFSGDERVIINRKRFFDLRANQVSGDERDYNICWASELVPCIGAEGKLWVCPNMRGLRELGDLNTETFEAIWQRRQQQEVGDDCRVACRNHNLNTTMDYIKQEHPHDNFV